MVLRLLSNGAEAVEAVDGIDAIEASGSQFSWAAGAVTPCFSAGLLGPAAWLPALFAQGPPAA